MDFCLKQKKTLSTGGRTSLLHPSRTQGLLFRLCLLSGNLLFFMRHGKDHRCIGKHCACDVEEHQKSAPVQHSDADDSNPKPTLDAGRTHAQTSCFSPHPLPGGRSSAAWPLKRIVSYSTPEILPFFQPSFFTLSYFSAVLFQ